MSRIAFLGIFIKLNSLFVSKFIFNYLMFYFAKISPIWILFGRHLFYLTYCEEFFNLVISISRKYGAYVLSSLVQKRKLRNVCQKSSLRFWHRVFNTKSRKSRYLRISKITRDSCMCRCMYLLRSQDDFPGILQGTLGRYS